MRRETNTHDRRRSALALTTYRFEIVTALEYFAANGTIHYPPGVVVPGSNPLRDRPANRHSGDLDSFAQAAQ